MRCPVVTAERTMERGDARARFNNNRAHTVFFILFSSVLFSSSRRFVFRCFLVDAMWTCTNRQHRTIRILSYARGRRVRTCRNDNNLEKFNLIRQTEISDRWWIFIEPSVGGFKNYSVFDNKKKKHGWIIERPPLINKSVLKCFRAPYTDDCRDKSVSRNTAHNSRSVKWKWSSPAITIFDYCGINRAPFDENDSYSFFLHFFFFSLFIVSFGEIPFA